MLIRVKDWPVAPKVMCDACRTTGQERMLKEDVHAKVANWSKLYSVQKEYELLVRKARAGDGNGKAASELEAEMKALAVKVDAAFREASDAVHGKRRTSDRPYAT
jgi:hypothetical protein